MQKMMRQTVVNLRKHGDLRDLRLSKIGDSINRAATVTKIQHGGLICQYH